MSDNIKVAVRMRPRIKREEDAQDYWTCDTTKSTITDIIDASGKLGSTCFQYDHVFGPQNTNWDIYSTVVQDIVASAMEGFNGTVFAYGQTGSGKTYTISGTDNDQERYGIIPNSVLEIFNAIENTPGREFLLRVSYMEIYNESVNDLLSSRKSLRIREDQNNQVFVEDLYEEIVGDPFDMFRLKDEGDDKRASADTRMNERSSRSHTIFRIIIESRERQEKDGEFVECSDSAVVISQLNLVDLAGFERASETNATGERLKEGCNINKSLSQLSQVILKLSDGAKEVAHVGFRNSKLTRILQNSLGGNSKTVIICNVTPAAKDQTKSTLLFAATAKTIKNCPVKNEILTEEALLKRYKTQISVLQSEIDQLREGASVRQLETQKSDLQKQLDDKETEISRLNNLICISSRLIDSPDPLVKARAKSRRETWCPGLDRHTNMARQLLSSPYFSAVRDLTKKHFEAAPKFDMECIDEDEPEECAEVPPVQDVGLDVFEVACQTNEDFWEDIQNKDLREAELQQEIEDLKRQLSSPNVTKTNMNTTANVFLGLDFSSEEKDDLIDSLKGEIEQQSEEMRRQTLHFESQLEQQQKEKLELETRILSLQEQFSREKDDLQETFTKMLTSKETEIEKLSEEMAQVKRGKEEEMATLKSECECKDAQIESLKQEMQELNDQIQSMTTRMCTATMETQTSFLLTASSLEDEHCQTSFLQPSIDEVNSLKEQNEKTEKALEMAKQDVVDYEWVLEDIKKKSAEQVGQLQGTIDDLQQKLSEKESEPKTPSSTRLNGTMLDAKCSVTSSPVFLSENGSVSSAHRRMSNLQSCESLATARVNDMIDRCECLQMDLNDANQKLDTMTEEKQSLEHEFNELKQMEEFLKAELSIAQGALSDMEKQFQQLKTNKDSLDEMLREQNAGLQSTDLMCFSPRLDEEEQEMSRKLQEDIESIKNELDAALKRASSAEKTSADFEWMLEEDRKRSSKEISTLKAMIAEVQEENLDVQRLLEEEKSKALPQIDKPSCVNESVETSFQYHAEDEMKQLQDQLTELMEKYSGAEQKLTELYDDIEKERAGHQKAMSQTAESKERLQKRTEELQLDNDELRRQLEQKLEVLDMSTCVTDSFLQASSSNTVSQTSLNQSELEKLISSNHGEITALQDQIRALETEKSSLEKELCDHKQNKAELTDQVEDLQYLAEEITKAKDEAETYIVTLQKEKREHDKELKRVKEKSEADSKEVATLHQSLEEERKKIAHLEGSNSSLTAEIQSLNTCLAQRYLEKREDQSLKVSLDGYTKEIYAKTRMIAKLKAEKQMADERNRELKRELRYIQEQHRDDTIQVKATGASGSSVDVRVFQLETSNYQLREQVTSLRKSVEEKTLEVEELRSDLEFLRNKERTGSVPPPLSAAGDGNCKLSPNPLEQEKENILAQRSAFKLPQPPNQLKNCSLERQ